MMGGVVAWERRVNEDLEVSLGESQTGSGAAGLTNRLAVVLWLVTAKSNWQACSTFTPDPSGI